MKLTQEAREAMNAYNRARRASKRTDPDYAAREREYQTAYRKAHPEKVQKWREAYWERKAAQMGGDGNA